MSAEPLPLFPLSTVLFPRMPLALHVFEPRYKRMIGQCLRGERPFGVLLIREGAEVGEEARATVEPERVGTLARIHAVEPLEEGTMKLLTEGTQRFRLLDLDRTSQPYLLGTVEPLKDSPGEAAQIQDLASVVTGQFRDYFNILVSHAGVTMPEYELPDDPEELSFVLASIVEPGVAFRQSVLEMTDTVERLTIVKELLGGEVDRIRAAARNVDRRLEPLDAEWRKPFMTKN